MIKCKKISIDMVKFYDTIGEIDTNNKVVDLEMNLETALEMLDVDIAGLILNEKVDKNLKNIYLLDERNIVYSCLNCIVGRTIGENLKLIINSIDIIVENWLTETADMKINEFTVKLSYDRKYVIDSIFEDITFNYSSSKKIIITKSVIERDIVLNICVKSKKLHNYEDMSRLAYMVVEMIFLLVGEMPTTEATYAFIGDIKTQYYFEIVDKYRNRNKKKKVYPLSNVNVETINKTNLRNFEKFRKKTKIIFDIFLDVITKSDYTEIKNSTLIQIIEGLFKTLTNTTLTLREILDNYFNSSKSMKKILSRRDKRLVNNQDRPMIFIYKLVNHRNYLSHLNLNQNKNVFYNTENIYAYYKLYLSLRVYIMEYVGIKCEYEKVNDIVNMIDNLSKILKIRFSLKLNS